MLCIHCLMYLYCNRSYIDRVVDDIVSWAPAPFTLQMTSWCRGSSSVTLGNGPPEVLTAKITRTAGDANK
jgi:hypothetical protein